MIKISLRWVSELQGRGQFLNRPIWARVFLAGLSCHWDFKVFETNFRHEKFFQNSFQKAWNFWDSWDQPKKPGLIIMSPGFFGWSQLPLRFQGFWKKFSSRKILSKFFSKSLKFPRFLRPAEKTRAHMGRFKNCPSVKTQRKSVPTMAKNQVIQNQAIPTTMVWQKISDTRKPNAIQYLLWPRINHFQKDFNRKR